MAKASTRQQRPRAAQLDLFGLSAEQQFRVDALTCLRDAVPQALEVVAVLRRQEPSDSRSPHASGSWAYCVSRAGFRFETRREWGREAHARGDKYGWDRTPANLIAWSELAVLIGHDPRRAEISAWIESLPLPRWRTLMRPHELWPDPDSWHIGYFCHDHVDKHWTARRHAWRLVLDLLNDAIESVAAGSAGAA